MVDNVSAVDAGTVHFDLNLPYPRFADIFADRQLRIVPKDKLGGAARPIPVGTGAFMFKSWSPGDRLELVEEPRLLRERLPGSMA